MKRREFITMVGGAAAWPLATLAQQLDRLRRVGIMSGGAENDPETKLRHAAFVQGLQNAGWTEGRNLRIDYRWTSADPERTRAYAAELVALSPDVIVAGSNQVTKIVSQQTHIIPIVFAAASEPLEAGLIPNMARPRGNVTGFALFEAAMAGKWLELLKEIAPRLTRVAAFYTPGDLVSAEFVRVISAAAPSIGIHTTPISENNRAEIERSLEAFSKEANGGLIALPGPNTLVHRDEIIALAARYRLPAIFPYKPSVTSGALMSYGTDNVDLYRKAASYVDRILKGEKPGDLPVQAPTKFELAINLKTAKALGLTVPPTLLAIADEVIE